MPTVVDTNVPIVANGRSAGALGAGKPSARCQLSAIDFLDSLLKEGRVLLDLAGEIQAEYGRHLRPAGQPGVGDRFYQVVLNSAPQRVERIDLPKAPNGSFVDFPIDPDLLTFDPSDRKFVALSLRSHAPVVVATDSDWSASKHALERNGLEIVFLCGCDPTHWFEA